MRLAVKGTTTASPRARNDRSPGHQGGVYRVLERGFKLRPPKVSPRSEPQL
jgi:hypothetical protein